MLKPCQYRIRYDERQCFNAKHICTRDLPYSRQRCEKIKIRTHFWNIILSAKRIGFLAAMLLMSAGAFETMIMFLYSRNSLRESTKESPRATELEIYEWHSSPPSQNTDSRQCCLKLSNSLSVPPQTPDRPVQGDYFCSCALIHKS